MDGNCGECNKPVGDQESVKCAGGCDRIFHVDCLLTDGVKTRWSKKEWCCEQCKKLKVKSTSSVGSNQSSSTCTGFTKEFLIKTLEAFKCEMFKELKANSSEFMQFRESLDMFSNKIDDATKLMEETNKRLSKLEKENQILRQNNTELQKTVSDLQVRMRSMEQYSRKNNIEISGIPVTKEEDVHSLLKDVGAAIGIQLKREEVQAAHRVPTFKAQRSQPLVVQFATRTSRDAWLTAYRSHRDLTASDIHKTFPKNKVFINEHLTPDTKVLLARTKAACKERGFKFVWCREGKIFVRKSEGERSIRIDRAEDMASIN